MKVKSLKKWLKEIPDNFEIDLSTIFLIKGEEDVMTCVLDRPIIGIADNPEHKHFRFIIKVDEMELKQIEKSYGKITRIK